MSDMTNPHDRLIRETLQDKKDAISFFKNSLPEKVIELLDLKRLELTQSSFISENLKEEQTDLLFQIPLKSGKKANVYLLFEHKSYLDEASSVPTRMSLFTCKKYVFLIEKNFPPPPPPKNKGGN